MMAVPATCLQLETVAARLWALVEGCMEPYESHIWSHPHVSREGDSGARAQLADVGAHSL